MDQPVCKKRYKELIVHDHKRIDPYYWLNERENPEVIGYLASENSYCDEQMDSTHELQKDLYEEITGRLDQTEESVPYLLDGYYYYNRYAAGKEYPLYCRKKGNLNAKEQLLLDNNLLAEGQDFCAVSKLSVDSTNQLVAYGVDFVSRRLYTICFKDLETGELLEDKIPNTSGGFTWSADGQYLFYVQKDEQTLRSNKVFRHKMGTSCDVDQLVFHEKEEAFISSVYKCKSKEYIFIGSYSSTSTEFQYLKSDDPLGSFNVFQAREAGHEYSVDHYEDQFYIVSNWNAKNFSLLTSSLTNTSKENWKELIPHRKEVLLEGIELFKNFLVVEERKAGLVRLRIINHQDQTEHYIEMEEESYMVYSSVNVEFDTEYYRYGYTSLVTPSSVYDYHFSNRTKTLQKQQKVVGGYDKAAYQSRRLNLPSHDGTMVPVSLVYHKALFEKGANDLLLYGYGSYGHVVDPSFCPARLSLLDRGFVFAIAHVRGGEDLGRQWYEEGKMLNKMNTFLDFIACGEQLIEQQFCSKNGLHAMGGSAGGLLMGAVINIKPQLWKSVIAAVPFVDVVTTMLDDSIPLTTGEYEEWGNPNDKVYYEYMLSYSPYDQVKAQDYPALLVTTGLHDSQVQYWEPAKWVAKLRDLKTNDSLLMLKTNMETGHGGASGRYEYYKEVAFEYAFLLKEANKI